MNQTKQNCELILSAPWLLPIAPQNVTLADHAVAINESKIIAIGPRGEIKAQFEANRSIDLPHHILMPGLVNAHGHAAMTLLRGAGEDQPLEQWLNDTIWPMEARLVDESFVQLGTELAIAEMLRSGTTTFSDMYFFPEVVAKLCADIGMRCQISFTLMDFANNWSQNFDDGLHKGLALIDDYRHNEFAHIAFGPHSAYVLELANLERVAMYANELDTRIEIHLHETATEVANARALHKRSWIEILHEIGLLSPHTQAVHMTQIAPHELDLVADSGAHVVHCPTSNLKLASGTCPVSQLHSVGINVALGTDGAASNNQLDLFDEARLAALVSKLLNEDAASGAAHDMIKMATLDGANALGLSQIVGSVEPGKQADIIAIDTHAFGMPPLYNAFSALVHGNAGNAVSDVFIGGKAMVSNSILTAMNPIQLNDRVHEWHERRNNT